jgi:hypothetical protein
LHKDKNIPLNPTQEEMAVAWVRKLGTEYVSDPVFVANFLIDFCKALNLTNPCRIEDFDFSEIQHWVDSEKLKRENMSKEAQEDPRSKQREIRLRDCERATG